jgi:hypothetical protein
MRGGRVLTLDEPAILKSAERLARAAWARSLQRNTGLAFPADLDLSV